LLELRGLVKRYGDVVALDDLSFTVPPGQMFGFVGTNGAGKTTAMRIVLGVLEADSGEVRWRGHATGPDDRRQFGYMPEERGLYPKMRVVDQLVYLARLRGVGRRQAEAAARRWLEVLGLSARAGDRVESLSLGNQQRVQLAAALLHEPELLVLDEPFSGLDPVGVDALAAVLRSRVDEGAAVVFSSHQLGLVEELCDAVGIVRAGSMVAVGTVSELRGTGRDGRWRLRVDAAPGWPHRLRGLVPGSRVDSEQDGAAVLALPAGADEQPLLRAAQTLGAVRELTPVAPTLAELFREVVTDAPAVEGRVA
jgi:ABC-2 type transport system ATP-binding protein